MHGLMEVSTDVYPLSRGFLYLHPSIYTPIHASIPSVAAFYVWIELME